MLKFFRIPFATSGDRTAVPDPVDTNGFVSYTAGYGFDYQRQKTDPAAKNIERDKMNEIFFDITTALAELQGQGVPDFITTALNGGTAYSYAQYAIVRYSGDLYISLVNTNTALPSDATKWALLPIPGRIQGQSYTGAVAAGTADALTAAFVPAVGAYPAAPGTLKFLVRAGSANTTTTPTFTPNSGTLAAKTIVKGNNLPLVAGDIAGAGHWLELVYDATLDKFVLGNPATGVSVVTPQVVPPVRQTVLSGPVDTNGLPSFGGSTGSTTVTATATLKATAAAGGDSNYGGSITNPSWTGLSVNGTRYLYLDITSAGVITTGNSALEPVYQWGGTYSVTNDQHTFNVQEMTMKVGNGSTATQTYRVFVGEVVISGGVVSTITWYGLMGRYMSPFTNTLPGTSSATSFNHNLGARILRKPTIIFKCLTTDAGYAVGDYVTDVGTTSTATGSPIPISWTAKTAQFSTGNSSAFYAPPKAGGAGVPLTAANWAYALMCERGW